MRLIVTCILITVFAGHTRAQDVFQKELFSVDLVMKYRSDINLSEAKVQSIKSIYNENISEFNSLKWDLDAAMNDLHKVLSATKVDESAADVQMKKVLGLEEDLKLIRLGMLVGIKNELTAEQQKKLKELRTSSDLMGQDLIAPLNEDPRVVLKVEGKKEAESPLYIIIDGKEERKVEKVSNLEPDDIESIEVFKGEKAIELYGNEGKNGVVVIKLKGTE